MVQVCPVCGKEFYVNYVGRKTCSRGCSASKFGTLEERLWGNVEKTTSGCWIWKRATYGRYGRLKVGGVQHSAHRLSWELFHRTAIPSGMFVLHECDVPTCIYPGHLRLGTAQENTQDMFAKGRARKAKGARHGNAKISEDEAREILHLASTKTLTQREIAARFGLHPVYVNKLVRGHKWAHLQG